MTDYYLSQYGSDANDGTSETTPWKSLSMVSDLRLQPGDRIFLERGSMFEGRLELDNESGSAKQPILITSYGSGEQPLIVNPNSNAIRTTDADHVIVRDIAIGKTHLSGIKGVRSDHWIIENVTLTESGGETRQFGAINWDRGNYLMFANNTIEEAYGDGMFLLDVSHVIVTNNILHGVNGRDADNVQFDHAEHVYVENNVMIAGTDAHASKGNMVFHGTNLYMHNNYLQGGAFGLSASADNIVVDGNITNHHNQYHWSMGIGLTDEASGDFTENILITNNETNDSFYAVSLFGSFEKRKSAATLEISNLDISHNTFYNINDWKERSVKIVDIVVNDGTYSHNTYVHDTIELTGDAVIRSDISALEQFDNMFAPGVIGLTRSVTIAASGDQFDGAPIMRVVKDNHTVVFETEVTALRSSGETQHFTFDVPNLKASDSLSIEFVNDKFHWPTGQDRNLYVHEVSIDGYDVSLSDASFSKKVRLLKHEDTVRFSSNGKMNFSNDFDFITDDPVIDFPPATTLDDFMQMLDDTGVTIGAHDGYEAMLDTASIDTSVDTLNHLLFEAFGDVA